MGERQSAQSQAVGAEDEACGEGVLRLPCCICGLSPGGLGLPNCSPRLLVDTRTLSSNNPGNL